MKAYLIFDDRKRCTQFEENTWKHINAYGVKIDIPDEATDVRVVPYNKHIPINLGMFIPIPHKKKKVKKAQYITINQDSLGRKRAEISGWLTEKEAGERGLTFIDKVPATEIEVEE